MARRCGYCRDYGHDNSKCKRRLDTIDAVLKHYYTERKRTVEMLIESGYGVGAMVQMYNYMNGEMEAAIITDPNDSVKTATYIDYRNVKYSKQTHVTFRSARGFFPTLDNWTNMSTTSSGSVPVCAVPVSGCNSVVHGYIHISDMHRSFINPSLEIPNKTAFSWERNGTLLVPSFDGEVNMDVVRMQVHIHERLDKKNRWQTPHP